MYKTLLTAGMMFAAVASTSAVAKPFTLSDLFSSPQPEVQQPEVQQPKKVVKKRTKKTTKQVKAPVKVAPEKNAFTKCDSVFGIGCGMVAAAPTAAAITYGVGMNAPSISNEDMSASQYWAEEAKRTQKTVVASLPKQSIAKNLKTREEHRREMVMNCSWFTCTPGFVEPVMEAKKWEGKTAKGNKKELQSLFADGKIPPIDPSRIPWCAAFANAILSRTGHATTGSLQARSFLHWGTKTKDPKEGDIVVLTRGRDGWSGHVGFFQGFEDFEGVKYVKVLAGNTDKAVQVGYFPVSKVLGYRTAA